MDRKSVESKMIRSIGYDASTSILEIEFNSGPVWQYYDVHEALWHEFEGTDSFGKFFHREIKNQFSESQIG